MSTGALYRLYQLTSINFFVGFGERIHTKSAAYASEIFEWESTVLENSTTGAMV